MSGMILISRKVDYGILSLFDLMRHPDGLSARELAERYRLSRPFIANILKLLCQEGLVESHRGVNGGYRLARSPSEITLEQVICALDGPFHFMSCASENEETACEHMKLCPVRSPLQAVHDRLNAVLAEVTLEDLGRHEHPLVTLQMESLPNGYAADLHG